MKKITNVNQIVENIDNSDGKFYKMMDGKFYEINLVELLNMSLSAIIMAIKLGILYSTHFDN